MPTIQVKTTKNTVFLTPTSLWPSSPIEVFLLMPAPNGVWEQWACQIKENQLNQSVAIPLPLTPANDGFTCIGLRCRTTAMPEHTGRAVLDVAREQDPPKPQSNRRDPIERLVFDRLLVTEPISYVLDLSIAVEAGP